MVPSDTESTSSFEPDFLNSQARKSRPIAVRTKGKERSRSPSRTKVTRQRSVSRPRTYTRANSGSEVVSRSETRESNSARFDMLSYKSEDSSYKVKDKRESTERQPEKEQSYEEDHLEYGTEENQNEVSELTSSTHDQHSHEKGEQDERGIQNEDHTTATDAELEGLFKELDITPSSIDKDVEIKARSSNGNEATQILPSRDPVVSSVRTNFENEEIKFTSSSESSKALSKRKKKFGKTFVPHNQEANDRSPLPKSIAELQVGNISPTQKKKLVEAEAEIPVLEKQTQIKPTSPPDEGCYLLYSPSSGGRFITIYSREKVDGAIGFWRPGPGKKCRDSNLNRIKEDLIL